MFKTILTIDKLSYRGLRAVQICIVMTFTVFIQEFLRYPSYGWTGFALMMIYAGFDNATTIFRAYHRFWGMMLGLLSGFLLWFIGHVDYRFLIIIIPITIFFANFLVGKAYSIPTIFTVNTALIGTGYFAYSGTYTVNAFIYNYVVATIFAFVICIVFEYFWFRRYNLMYRFVLDTQSKMLNDLTELFSLLNSTHLRKSKFLYASILLRNDLTTINNLLTNAEFVYSSQKVIGDKFVLFANQVTSVFHDLNNLYTIKYINKLSPEQIKVVSLEIEHKLSELQLNITMPLINH